MTVPDPSSPLPSSIAGYRIERVLGGGARSTVYLAKHPTLPQWHPHRSPPDHPGHLAAVAPDPSRAAARAARIAATSANSLRPKRPRPPDPTPPCQGQAPPSLTPPGQTTRHPRRQTAKSRRLRRHASCPQPMDLLRFVTSVAAFDRIAPRKVPDAAAWRLGFATTWRRRRRRSSRHPRWCSPTGRWPGRRPGRRLLPAW